ncbi:extracellular calcium-sensing receptor-like [Erpetoichthys calabaricus]|uniref:extracellular calcium-sensing receptor-like n=1 Tax=Erpetoichthys calabaricus TaxID=27687 RepID=UPI002234E01A|nr:extracellular calcium-sensing receptor-like [Erpetoichthys calabaricus]
MKCILHISVLLCLTFILSNTQGAPCKLQGKFELSGLYKSGDIMLGGIFVVNFKTVPPEIDFRSKPVQWKCESFEFSVFQKAQIMAFAIEEVNKRTDLLPNITLGYQLYDNCVSLPVSLRVATTLISTMEDVVSDLSCNGPPPVVAIIGDPLSAHSIAISRILSLFQMPMVSYYATCSCLSNKQEFPTFFRTVPSDAFQVKAVIQIIKRYGWTWVGAIATDDDYGQYAIKIFLEEFQKYGCVSFIETVPSVTENNIIRRIVKSIKQSTATVIVVFSSEEELNPLIKEIVLQNITGKQWIASEAWSTSSVIAIKENFVSFGGVVGIAIRRGEIPGLQDFLLQIRPDYDLRNNLIIQFWEKTFNCKFLENENTTNASRNDSSKICTGLEDITSTYTAYNDVSELRSAYNVHKAVYALAHALHNLMNCKDGYGPFENNTCANIRNVQSWQLLHYLKNVNFTNHLGERVAFDENGDPLAIYDIVNWQQDTNGAVKIKSIGLYDASSTTGDELIINEEDIFWNFEYGLVAKSICSESCQPGTRKSTRKGEPFCCFDCIPCADGEVSIALDSTECFKCPDDFWSNDRKTECVLKEIEFLSYDDAMGVTLTTISAFGACLSLSVLIIFIHYRHTPVVKANNSELSFLLLVSLILCFLCALCFIGKPSNITCILRHVAFGISFVLCISCILVKTIVVIMAFNATLPGNNTMKWFGVTQQRGTVLIFTLIQSIVCTIWMAITPSIPTKNTRYQMAKIIFECDVGSVTGFSCLLGYIGLLAGACFVLAFLARNLPDNFNEAKFITFSMLIFCAVWITFIPAYISSPGKHTVAVEVFAILASSYGLLFAIFSPKCYIILFKPELNTKKALMGRAVTTK